MTLPRIPHVVAGARHAAHSTRPAPFSYPPPGAVAAHVPLADAVDIETVIADAAAAAPAWGARSALDRARVLFRWRELCLAHADELAHLISREHGKVVADARGELQRGLEVVEFATGIPHLIKGEFSDGVARGIDMHSMRQPLGMVSRERFSRRMESMGSRASASPPAGASVYAMPA